MAREKERTIKPALGLPRYDERDLLGEGGMGEVYRARDKIAARDVALKIVHRARARKIGADLARFVREACVQAQLEHPGVVAVYDVGQPEKEGARPYFTMRIVEGVTLAEVIKRLKAGDPEAGREFTRHRLLTAFLQVCLTVDYAHARGIIHRDIKPANVMLGSYGEVYVLDWGVAKTSVAEPVSSDDGGAAPARMTSPGMTMGTRGYMPPEQARDEQLDPRADVFALGATLFELLALEPLLDTAQAKKMGTGPLVYDAAPSSRGANVPPELDAICIKATAHDKVDRFASARELHDAIEAVTDLADRQRLAAEHRARAREAADRALASNDEDARERALGELGRALALAPDDAAGRRLLVELLSTPPKTVPPAVAAEQAKANEERLRRMQLTAAGAYTLTGLVLFPAWIAWAGILRPIEALLPSLAWAVASAMVFAIRRFRIYDTLINYAHVTTMFAVAATSFLAGPHFLVPAIATATLMGHLLVAARRQRPTSVVFTCLAVVVPAVFAWTGIHPTAKFVPDGMELHAAVRQTKETAYVGFTVVHVFAVLAAATFAHRFRAVLDTNVLKNELFAWQLAKVVPEAGSKETTKPMRFRGGARPLELAEIHDAPRLVFGDRYERVRKLEGNDGLESWIGRDRWLGREIKMTYCPSAPGSEEEKGFLASALELAKIEHPAIAPIYDVGNDASGKSFFTTKLLRGDSLEEDLKRRGHSLRRHLSALNKACLAVAHVHTRDIVHGNITPASILLGPFGEVYVTGWGEHVPNATKETDVRALAMVLAAILEAHAGEAPELEAERTFATPRDVFEAIEGYLAGDRDAALRDRLASAHRERALAAADRALKEGDDVARVEALGAIGNAVALAPDAESLRLLLSLLTTPPKEPPPEVVEKVEARRTQRARAGARVASLFIGGMLALYCLVVVASGGVRDLAAVVIVGLLWLFAEVALVAGIFRAQDRIPYGMILMMLAIGATSALSGPFLILPALAAVTTMAFALIIIPKWRVLIRVLGVGAVMIPTILQVTGAYPFYTFTDNRIFVNSVLRLEPAGAFYSITIFHLLCVLFAADYSSRFRDALDAAEAESLFATWQLSKIVGQK